MSDGKVSRVKDRLQPKMSRRSRAASPGRRASTRWWVAGVTVVKA